MAQAWYYAPTQSYGKKNINKRPLCTLRQRISPLLLTIVALVGPLSGHALEIETPPIGLTDVPMEIVITGAGASGVVAVSVGEESIWATADADGRAVVTNIKVDAVGPVAISATLNGESVTTELRVLPGWISVMPAFLAIAVALLIRNVVPALLLGLWLGATALVSFNWSGAGKGLLDTFAVFIMQALADSDHAAIICFTMMIGQQIIRRCDTGPWRRGNASQPIR